MQDKTIIVGGGIAGLSSALELLEAGQDFRLITENLGGRIQYSEPAKINFGAYFVMRDYTYAKKVLRTGAWINPADACFHNSSTERFSLVSGHTLKRLPELLRFLGCMRTFAAHYRQYKQRCLSQPQEDALHADPYMARLFSTPAAEWIAAQHLENVAEDYVAKFSYACTGASPQQLTALDFLNVSMGMITPIRHLVFDRAAVAARLGERLVFDTIRAVEPLEGGYRLRGASGGETTAQNVILATPASVTQQLLNLPEIRSACRFYVFHLRGTPRPLYRRTTLNLFPTGAPFLLISREHDGSYLVYARAADADLHELFETYEVLATVAWEKAMYISGRAFMKQRHAAGLYVAGDHNGLGLEPAAISGIYAARQIIHSKEPA
jgi:glycine/D-amino acid oxidase-like deaminating enzyme